MACVNKVLPASATLHVYPQVEWAISCLAVAMYTQNACRPCPRQRTCCRGSAGCAGQWPGTQQTSSAHRLPVTWWPMSRWSPAEWWSGPRAAPALMPPNDICRRSQSETRTHRSSTSPRGPTTTSQHRARQSTTADFDPAATWWVTVARICICPVMWKHDVIHETGSA